MSAGSVILPLLVSLIAGACCNGCGSGNRSVRSGDAVLSPVELDSLTARVWRVGLRIVPEKAKRKEGDITLLADGRHSSVSLIGPEESPSAVVVAFFGHLGVRYSMQPFLGQFYETLDCVEQGAGKWASTLMWPEVRAYPPHEESSLRDTVEIGRYRFIGEYNYLGDDFSSNIGSLDLRVTVTRR